METLRDLAVQLAKKKTMVDDLTNEAPILDKVLWSEAVDPYQNTVSKLATITGAGVVDINEVLPKMSATEKLVKVDLQKMGGTAEVTDDTARIYGGASAYFAKREPKFLRQAGNAVEKEIVQKIMLKYALDNGKAFKTSASGGQGYTLYAVRFVDDETCGLYGKGQLFKAGDILERLPLSGGKLHTLSSGQSGYAMEYKGFYGFQIMNDHTVAALCNIQQDKLPTATQIEDLLGEVRAGNSNTYLFCAPKCLTLLSGLKTSYLRTDVTTKDMNVTFTHWNGVPIVASYNLTAEDFHSIA